MIQVDQKDRKPGSKTAKRSGVWGTKSLQQRRMRLLLKRTIFCPEKFFCLIGQLICPIGQLFFVWSDNLFVWSDNYLSDRTTIFPKKLFSKKFQRTKVCPAGQLFVWSDNYLSGRTKDNGQWLVRKNFFSKKFHQKVCPGGQRTIDLSERTIELSERTIELSALERLYKDVDRPSLAVYLTPQTRKKKPEVSIWLIYT